MGGGSGGGGGGEGDGSLALALAATINAAAVAAEVAKYWSLYVFVPPGERSPNGMINP